MPQFTPQQYARRDTSVLWMAADYRVLLPSCTAAKVGRGKPLTHALNRMSDSGDLRRHDRCLPGGLTGYTLTATAAARLGLPRDRAELPTGAALDYAIAAQVFCCLGRQPRNRLSAEEARTLLGSAAPSNVAFAASAELDSPLILRLVLAANRSPMEVLRYLRTLHDQALRHSMLNRWVASRQLGFALLAPDRQNAAALEKTVARSGMLEKIAIVVDLGPDAEHLSSVLKGLKANET